MNGVHDLGGMDGFGRVQVEPHEPVFHHAWERRVFGLTVAASAQRLSNTDAFRHAIERMEPVHYLGSSYYEHWLTGLATLLVERGVVTRDELATRAGALFPLSRSVRAGTSVPASSGTAPRFAVGNPVQVRNVHPLGHTRCPRYVRGKRGVVTRIDGRFALPDVAAHSDQRCVQFSYNVRFDGAELWGDSTGVAEAVHVDLWEEYLETP
jgi:nitrile hydratase subunit beta